MRATRRKFLGLTASTGLGLVIAGRARAATHQVTIQGRKFIPADLTVSRGDTVVFSNVSGSHTATALDGSFDTGTLKKGESGQITLPTKGTFPYRCRFHSSMTGTITVV